MCLRRIETDLFFIVRESTIGGCLRGRCIRTIILQEGTTSTNPSVPVRNEGKGHQMFNIWDVVEELAAVAYEHHTKRISMSQIRKHLKAANQESPHTVEEVRKTLIQLGYHIGGTHSFILKSVFYQA